MQLAATEGLAGFYRGFGAMLVGLVPASMAYYGGYESGKALIPAKHGVLGDMAVGIWAQLVAGVVYTPIDIVKERLQVPIPPMAKWPYCQRKQHNTIM